MRKCIKCNAKITSCMGFVFARDFLSQKKNIREICGKCALKAIDNINIINYHCTDPIKKEENEVK